ncbi:MAG: hypothetical protein WA885_05460, partial [Phormidesmis sp.]
PNTPLSSASPPPVIPTAEPPSPEPRSTIRPPTNEKKKTNRQPTARAAEPDVGEDWEGFRSAAKRDSWTDDGQTAQSTSGPEQQKRGLFDFIKPGGAQSNPDQLTDDIAAGWHEQSGRESQANYDRPEQYSQQYSEPYAGQYDDGLDQGWEGFDNYDETPPAGVERRVYRDGLYGDGDRAPYPEDSYSEEPLDEIGPDGVYEADYRVIVPPSKALDDDDDERDYRP